MPTLTLPRESTQPTRIGFRCGVPVPGHPGWYLSDLNHKLAVMAHESSRGRPIQLRRSNIGRQVRIVVYRRNGDEVEFLSLRAACAFALEG